MKNTTATSGTEEMPDFLKANLNEWHFADKLTLPVIFSFLSFLRTVMCWLETEGKKLLDKVEPLSFEEWQRLYDKSWLLCRHLGYSQKAISRLHLLVVKKGIHSLAHWLREGHRDKEIFGRWLSLIESDTRAGSFFGLGSHHCKKEESWELIDSMVPVAQILQSEPLLESFAKDRFSNDPDTEALYIKAHKNW